MALLSFTSCLKLSCPLAIKRSMSSLPQSSIPCFNTVAGFRKWRETARDGKKSVGFVPTMGALHDGHISLVRKSLSENDLTAMSIFVNPAQFAPHEDLATYPKTLESDLHLATQEKHILEDGSVRTVSAVFVPTVSEMYPSGISQSVSDQKGTFLEVKGYGEQMEGKSRPTFFRGVATVVIKLFNVVEPTRTYFGQKDIQQALLIRRLCRDLLLSHPTPENHRIVPTKRDPTDGLALSSRNTYLSAEGRQVAPTLYAALRAAQAAWESGFTKRECLQRAIDLVNARKYSAVDVRVDYIEFNDSETLEDVDEQATMSREADATPIILSGAIWVDKTRLIDNIILGNTGRIW